jgi:CHASE1-domain containing sensor protein
MENARQVLSFRRNLTAWLLLAGGLAALSGRVTLVQETNEDVQAGTLMNVPVYRHRGAALQGWVYSPYRMTDLMNGILRNPNGETRQSIRLKVYDSADLNSESLL